MNCSHCRNFLHDHLTISAQLAFPTRANRIPKLWLSQEIGILLTHTLEDSKGTATLTDTCKTMEMFCGREATVKRFFSCFPRHETNLQALELELCDFGLGSQEAVSAWIRSEYYTLFQVLLPLHLQHTQQAAPMDLGAPIPYARTGQAKLPALKVPQRNFTEDDLYD